jgi:tungstate transport system ATP-binding protein
MIVIEDVRKSYGGEFTLSVERLEIGEGGVTALLGPNGSGKSTLLGVLAGIVPADRGAVRMGEMELAPRAQAPVRWRRRVTMLAQKPFLFNGTVHENLAWGLRLRGIPRRAREEKIARVLSRMGLDGFARRHARALSGGEAQMVALARALVLEPRLLLLDEPTAHIDRDNAGRVEEFIRALGGNGCPTVILATHNLAQARRLAGTVISLDEGRVEAGERVPTGN